MNRVIVHLSDLHFGRIDPATLDPLVQSIVEIGPDLVAVSGDLTQRARRGEFEQARAFLNRLPRPQIVVPGNHDVPLHNPWSRFVSKWSRFEEYINPVTQQTYVDDAISVVGINTGRAFTWKGGRINAAQIESVRNFFCQASVTALKVLVVHHPMDIPRHWGRTNQSGRAGRALALWGQCGVDLILAGHVHRAFAGAGSDELRLGDHRAVIVQAGTATSTRSRGEPNSFNVIRVSNDDLGVTRQTWIAPVGRFLVTGHDNFPRNPFRREKRSTDESGTGTKPPATT